ncbi:hypothetical protein [Sphaerisporangium album]|nr:hypothetical protein [Sphaerisporangium album]
MEHADATALPDLRAVPLGQLATLAQAGWLDRDGRTLAQSGSGVRFNSSI